MPQISGLKWKDQTLHDLDVFRERKLKMTKKDDLEEFGDIGGAASLNIDSAMIARFLREAPGVRRFLDEPLPALALQRSVPRRPGDCAGCGPEGAAVGVPAMAVAGHRCGRFPQR